VITENAIQTRFESKYEVDPVTFCWLWTAGTTDGYGRFWVDGEMVYAHRWSYEWFREPLPPWEPGGMELHHICGRQTCVNPWHLELVTRGAHMDTEGQRKLTEDQVLEIRARSAFGDTRKELGLRFGVSQQQISNIIRRENWKHI